MCSQLFEFWFKNALISYFVSIILSFKNFVLLFFCIDQPILEYRFFSICVDYIAFRILYLRNHFILYLIDQIFYKYYFKYYITNVYSGLPQTTKTETFVTIIAKRSWIPLCLASNLSNFASTLLLSNNKSGPVSFSCSGLSEIVVLSAAWLSVHEPSL